MKARFLSASVAVLVTATATSAFAQDNNFARNRNTSVRERPRPDYEALGIGQGGLRLLPQITATYTHDDNVFASTLNPVDDSIYSTTGEVTLISDWNVHQLGATAKVRHDSYSDNSTEDQTVYNLSASGRLDATSLLSFNGGARYQSGVEPRTASGNPSASVDPIEYQATGFDLGAVKVFNRLRLRAGFTQDNYDYDDGKTAGGLIIDQDYRDEKSMRGSLHLDYAVSPDTAVYIDGSMNKRDYDQKFAAPSLVERGSDGWEINGGADFDITNLVRGSIQAGYLEQDYDDPSIPSSNSVSGRVSLEYFPTEIATITIRASRTVEDTGLITVPTFLSSNYSVQMDYELLRNVIITGRVSLGDDSYQGISRKDTRNTATLSGVWLINRRLGLSTTYDYMRQSSTGLLRGPDYDIHRISASLTLQY